MVVRSGGLYLVFEYLKYDLDRFIKDDTKTMDPHVIKVGNMFLLFRML